MVADAEVTIVVAYPIVHPPTCVSGIKAFPVKATEPAPSVKRVSVTVLQDGIAGLAGRLWKKVEKSVFRSMDGVGDVFS